MSKLKPSQSELEILQSLWERKQATVRQVHEDIQQYRPVGYTTTLKQMQRMHEKGMVEQLAKSGRAHLYRAVLKPRSTRKQLVDRLVSTAFDGSANALVLHALGSKKPSHEEIAQIRELLEKYERDD